MIVFGAFGVLMLLRTALMSSSMAGLPGADQNPALAIMQSPEFVTYMKVMSIPSLIGGVLGIVAGIGMLKGREWGRKSGLFWTAWQLLTGLAGIWASFTYMLPMFAKMPTPRGMKAEEAEIFRTVMSAFMTAAIGVGAVFAIALPIVVLVLLTRPAVVAYCRSTPSVPPPLGV